jgi:glycosyltransferase involved in cell wall biosynthesis
MLPRILAVSFFYPPSATPRAVQVARLLTHVNGAVVLACSDFANRTDRWDELLAAQTPDSKLMKVTVPFSRSAWDGLVFRAAHRFKLPIVNRTPDSYKKWNRSVCRALEPIFRNQSFDAVVTFGAPMTDHLIGLTLKEQFGLRWIAHFSDPWTDNPFTTADSVTNYYNRRLERAVIAASDITIFTSAETIDLVFSKYPSDWKQRARVLPHAFDRALFTNRSGKRDDVIRIRYLGEFYGSRAPDPLVRVLAELHRTEPEILKNVSFEFVSNLSESQLPKHLVELRKPIGYLESLKLMNDADALLVIDAPNDFSVFLPSKLIDYLGARRPIFGITPPGTAANLIRELNGWVADPSDHAGIRSELKSLLGFLREARTEPWGKDDVISRYEISRISRQFTELLLELTSAGVNRESGAAYEH